MKREELVAALQKADKEFQREIGIRRIWEFSLWYDIFDNKSPDQRYFEALADKILESQKNVYTR